ncbi:MAG: VTT domain-containing protein [Crocinitomicaceae bacterium]|nr:VTT domain-containing protein [Crocinitomicaceae bacterium]
MLVELGILGLFIGCFLSATIVPFSSDALFATALIADYPSILALIAATAGNFLGTLTNYWIGYFIRSKRDRIPNKIEVWESRIRKYGVLLGLLGWVPFIGEPMILIFGYLRINFWRLSIFIFLGVFGRYLIWWFILGN